MKLRSMAKITAALVWITALLAGCSCGDALVTGKCAPGYLIVGGQCVMPKDGSVVSDGSVPDAAPDGAKDGGTDGAVPDGEVPEDGAVPDGAITDSGMPDAAPDAMVGCGVGELECDGVCVRPDLDKNHCGDCTTMCAMGEVCVAGVCGPACPMPRTVCPMGCADLTKDPDNCGTCGKKCPLGICSLSHCEEPAPGHLILIGHDYRKSNKNMNRIAGNAIFMAQGQTVQVLTYVGGVTNLSLNGINAALDEVATARGRAWAGTSAAANFVPYLLGTADVFMIYPQRNGTDAALLALGAQWKTALHEFLNRGGILVVFDGTALNKGTWQILDGAGLFHADGPTTLIAESLVNVTLPVDSVVLGVPLTYTAMINTVWFNTTNPNVVVRHPAGPVVFHEVFVPDVPN